MTGIFLEDILQIFCIMETHLSESKGVECCLNMCEIQRAVILLKLLAAIKRLKWRENFQNDTLKLLSLLLYVFNTILTALTQNTEPKHF